MFCSKLLSCHAEFLLFITTKIKRLQCGVDLQHFTDHFCAIRSALIDYSQQKDDDHSRNLWKYGKKLKHTAQAQPRNLAI